MRLRRLIPVVLLATLLAPAWVQAAESSSKTGPVKSAPLTKNRIVIQINEDDTKKWNTVLANIHNIQVELGAKNVAIALVAIGPGLRMLDATSLVANGVQDAMANGVEFVACGNTMKAMKVSKDDLIDGVTVSVAGYVELMRRQQQGWAYLRP